MQSSPPLARYLLLALCLLTVGTQVLLARSIYDEISSNPELSKFKEWIDKDDILPLFLKKRACTAFAPTNQAIAAFQEKNPDPNALSIALANYHAASAVYKRDQFPIVAQSMDGKFAPLYLSVQPFGPVSPFGRRDTDKFYYINNAFVLDAREDLTTEKGSQSLYIIDEVLSAFEPTESVAPNALELIANPGIYKLGDLDLRPFQSQIRRNGLESLFSQPGRHTFFVPTKVPGSAEFDKYVVKAHVVPKNALFVRTLGDKIKYNTLAYDANVEVELSLVNLTGRFSNDKTYYIQTNTVKNDAAHHLGKVLSRLTPLANIPVKNGIVHIIDKPLMLMDMAVRDFLRSQNKLRRFTAMLDKHPDILSEMGRNSQKTILAPEDNAFENLMNNNQNFSEIDESSEEIKKLLRQHIVYHSVSSSDLKKSNNYAVYNSSGGIPVGFRLIGYDSSARLTVESGGVNATSTQSDFGASDGILHIVDRVLGMPFKTLREKLRQQPDLTTTFKLGTQGGTANWNGKLADENKRYTFFAPSNAAWEAFKVQNPSEYHQLEDERYPPISRAIFDRHLTAKGQYNRKDLLQTVKRIDSVQGELIINPDPITKEIYVEWEGLRAKVIKYDIYGLNGVIHIVDTVLSKKRDFKVNSAPHCQLSTALLGLTVAASIFMARRLV